MTLTEQIITIGMVVLGTMITRFAVCRIRAAGYLLPEERRSDAGQSRNPRAFVSGCCGCSAFVETTDASLDCRRHSFLYGTGSADILMSDGRPDCNADLQALVEQFQHNG